MRHKRLSRPARALICAALLAPATRAGSSVETTRTPYKAVTPAPRRHSIDVSHLKEADLRKWQKVVGLANEKDTQGRYAAPVLHETFERLDSDVRTFVIVNESLGTRTVGKFTITKFNGPDDFSEATIALDFERVKSLQSTTPGDFDVSFRKYEGLFGKDGFVHRLAETFGHEANHAVFALQKPRAATELQHMLDKRDADFRALPIKHRYPLPSSMLQDMQAADAALIDTERFAQQAEKEIHDELAMEPGRAPRPHERGTMAAAATGEQLAGGEGR